MLPAIFSMCVRENVHKTLWCGESQYEIDTLALARVRLLFDRLIVLLWSSDCSTTIPVGVNFPSLQLNDPEHETDQQDALAHQASCGFWDHRKRIAKKIYSIFLSFFQFLSVNVMREKKRSISRSNLCYLNYRMCIYKFRRWSKRRGNGMGEGGEHFIKDPV